MAVEDLDGIFDKLLKDNRRQEEEWSGSGSGAKSHYLKLLQYLNELALNLIYETAENLPGIFDNTLEEVGQLLKAYKLHFYFKEEKGNFINISSASAGGDYLSILFSSTMVERRLSKKKPVIFSDLREIPVEAFELRENFRTNDLKSLLIIPAVKENRLQGFFWLELQSKNVFTDQELCDFLARLGRVLINALERYRREIEIHLVHKQISNHLADLVCVLDQKGIFKFISGSCQKILGFQAEDLQGTSFFDLIYREDRQRLNLVIENPISEVSSERLDFRLKNASGNYLWVEATGDFLVDSEGIFDGAVVNIRDISERKRLEKTLSEKTAEMELVLDNIKAHVFCLQDPETNGYVNKAAAEFIGRDKAEMKDRKIRDIFQPEQAELLIKKNQLVFKKKKQLSYEVELEDKDGEKRTLFTTVTPRLDENNHVNYAICAAMDITEFKNVKEKLVRSYLKTNRLARDLEKANRSLKEKQRLFRLNFEESKIGMALKDSELGFIRVNRAFAGMLGYSKTELKKATIRDITHPDDLEKTLYYTDRLLSGEIRSASFEKRYLTKDGQVVWGSIHISLARDETGKPLFFIVQIEDITSKKRIETVFKQQKEELEYSRLKTQFFANLSHELRTPLNLIFSTLKLLTIYKDKQLGLTTDKRLCRYISLIRQNGYRLLRMVNNLIDLTRIDSDYYRLNMGNHDIAKLLREIISSTRDYVLSKNRSLVFDNLQGKKLIYCDPYSIERILLNLISNALKFTAEGDEITVSLEDRGDSIILAVKDNGIGIKKNKLSIIFEQFRQVEDNIFRRNNEGSGMGLAIVKKLVEMHQGKVWVESEYGRGSEFLIELPVRAVPGGSQDYLDDAPANVPQELIDRIVMEFSDI